MDSNSQIEIKDLQIAVTKNGRRELLVKGINLTIRKNETVCLVGESGSGKSLTSLAIMGLLPTPPISIVGGQILLRDGDVIHDLVTLEPRGRAYRQLRGRAVSMIFQEPTSSLNPVHRNGAQIVEVIRAHTDLSKKAAWERMMEMLRLVGISSPEIRARQFPHQLSGGMRQRIMIALALACRPGLLLADEPTTALDVTTQAQILEEIRKLSRISGTSTLFITHDLGVVAQLADKVYVMYQGEIVERGEVRDIFHNPLHPYTKGLLASVPSLATEPFSHLEPIKGTVRDIPEDPGICPFLPRCDAAQATCKTLMPRQVETERGHMAKCWI